MNIDSVHLKGKYIVLTGFILYLAGFLFGMLSQGVDIRGPVSYREKYRQEEKADLDVSDVFINKIFLNNLGLNMIIISGAFSLLAFSLMVLLFNGIQIGYLIKGLYSAYNLKIALMLVMPHLIVEVFTHMLSLYMAYYFLSEFIIPAIAKGEHVYLSSGKVQSALKLLISIIAATYSGAVVEVFVTPALI